MDHAGPTILTSAGLLVGFPYPDSWVRISILASLTALLIGSVVLYWNARRGRVRAGLVMNALFGLVSLGCFGLFFRVSPLHPFGRTILAVLNSLFAYVMVLWLAAAAFALLFARVRRRVARLTAQKRG